MGVIHVLAASLGSALLSVANGNNFSSKGYSFAT
jgi:hypothetical protein